MNLVVYEWRKLFRLPALWGFLALCLAFNWLLIGSESYGRELFNEVGAVTEVLGQRVDGDFLAGLAARPSGDLRDALAETAAGMENLYEDYEVSGLSQFYQDTVEKSPLAVRWMAWKYRQLEVRIEHLARTGAAMDFYAGPLNNLTHDSFQFLFGTLMRAMVLESAVLGMLAALYLLGYEDIYRTAQQVYASRAGRRLCRTKVLAGVTAALALYAVLAMLTLLPYFLLWDYGGVWGASVSSQFNYLTDMLLRRPFLTWADFTVAGYLAAALALGAALTAVFALLAAVCGLLLRNTYVAALALAALGFGGVGLASMLAQAGLWTAYFLALVHPSCVWLCINGWFTELGLSAAIPWQETAAVGLDLLALSLGTSLALGYFRRKDIVT